MADDNVVIRSNMGTAGQVIVMVGLPARGKTYIAKKLTRSKIYMQSMLNLQKCPITSGLSLEQWQV